MKYLTSVTYTERKVVVEYDSEKEKESHRTMILSGGFMEFDTFSENNLVCGYIRTDFQSHIAEDVE